MNSDNKTVEQFIYEESVKEKERIRINLSHIQSGVTLIDWKNTYIDPEVTIGEGTVIYPGTVLQGKTSIGKKCVIRQNCRVQDSTLADGVEAENSVILESTVGRDAKIGPFAYIRPGSNIGECAKVGDFVEVKNSTLGSHSKASHLTYIGDADVGEHVNLGCGVVFVNYDGTHKHRSTIGDGAFIGCNTNIVSPVTVGEDAYVAAGTTLTGDVPGGALAVGRAKQKNIEGWTVKRGLLKKKK